MNQVSHRCLKDTPEEPIQCVKSPHLGVRKIEILTDGRQERRNDPTEPIIDGVGKHEHHQNEPAVSVLRSHELLTAFLRVESTGGVFPFPSFSKGVKSTLDSWLICFSSFNTFILSHLIFLLFLDGLDIVGLYEKS